MPKLSRRKFLGGSSIGLGLATSGKDCFATHHEEKTRVAAIQFKPVLGDVDANLEICGKLIEKADSQGARWIVLPEFFTSGMAIDKRIWDSYRPLHGEPFQFLKNMASAKGVYLGGSYLAVDGQDVFNTFVLATPSGHTFTHDKDFPSTDVESSFYAGGEDDAFVKKIKKDGFKTLETSIPPRAGNNTSGRFKVDDIQVGTALCWELIRYRTAKRLTGTIDILLGASGWWWGTPEFGWPDLDQKALTESRNEQIRLITEAPRRLARTCGVPVVHANFAGVNESFSSNRFDKKMLGRFLGRSQIVDRTGTKVQLLNEDPGIAVGEVCIGKISPSEEIPEKKFWMPEVSEATAESWSRSGASGRDFYLTTTRNKIAGMK